MDLTPNHLGLGELIERLRAEPNQARRVRVGFRDPHSYRGYYEQLAFEIAEDVTVGEMLAAAESALGSTYHGWKGGDYTMSPYTDTWLVAREGECGESLGALLLELLLRNDDAAYRAGHEDAARAALRAYADRYHYLAGGHGPISTSGGWIDPDAWCACGAAWSDDEGGCTERAQLLAEEG